MFERISIELTNRCSKGCSFCYNASRPGGMTLWTVDEVVKFVEDCALHGVKAVSFGGGEPLEFAGLFDVLRRLDGTLFRSVTTNGLLLDDATYDSLVGARPDKVHISVHFPQSRAEVTRVTRQVTWLAEAGIQCGVNLLVARSQLDAARQAARALADAGLDAGQIVYLPMRGHDTPTAGEVGTVASFTSFQSMTCLLECGPSQRFCSIRWDKTVGWCSYTESRRAITPLTYDGLCAAMEGIGLKPCDGSLVPLSTLSPIVKTDFPPVTQSTDTPFVIPDIPAAHSMDTEWFATDKDGHVAMFDTGEPGLMPKIIEESNDFRYDGFVEEIFSEESASLAYDLADLFSYGKGTVIATPDRHYPADISLEKRITTIAELTNVDGDDVVEESRGFFSRLVNWRSWGSPRRGYPKWSDIDAVCWLRDANVMKRLPPKSRFLNVGDQVAAWVPECPARLLRQLYDEGLVLGVMAEEFYPAAYRFGLYVYESGDYDKGSYKRTAVPRRPVKAHQLHEYARFESERVSFTEITFTDTIDLQVADYLRCIGWGAE